MSPLLFKTLPLPDANVSYIESGSNDLPTLLLLHGFPTSAEQYNTLIPQLSDTYHVLAPSYPGFGATTVSPSYQFTFSNLTATVSAFLIALNVTNFAAYIFDYGAPIFYRLALDLPSNMSVSGVIVQNGNAYVEGLGQDFWAPVEQYWKSNSTEDREAVRTGALSPEAIESQYRVGVPDYKQSLIDPARYNLDYLQNIAKSSGRQDAQLDLLYDYRNNVEMYPQYQQWIRESDVPLTIVWGKGDVAFTVPGAEAYKRDAPNVRINLLNTGHFAVATDATNIATYIRKFLASINY